MDTASSISLTEELNRFPENHLNKSDMNRVFFCIAILFLSFSAGAQTYSLQQCIDSALKNDIPVQQSGLTARAAEINLKQSRNNLLPDLNSNINHGMNSGRSIDP